jgi:hypothetical protein
MKRIKNEVKTKTVSLWQHVNSNIGEYFNEAFIEFDGVLQFSADISQLKIWHAYYSKHREGNETSLADPLNYQRVDSIGNIFENFTPNFLSNGYKLLNHIKFNLKN